MNAVFDSGAPTAEGRQAEPHTQRKVKETHELLFSWLAVVDRQRHASSVFSGIFKENKTHSYQQTIAEVDVTFLTLGCTEAIIKDKNNKQKARINRQKKVAKESGLALGKEAKQY